MYRKIYMLKFKNPYIAKLVRRFLRFLLLPFRLEVVIFHNVLSWKAIGISEIVSQVEILKKA